MTGQPMPNAGRERVPEHTLADFKAGLAQQTRKGVQKYGTSLETWNGRDAGMDAWEELIDLAQYLTQLRMERADMRGEIARLRALLAEHGIEVTL